MHGSSGRPIIGANPDDFARIATGAILGRRQPSTTIVATFLSTPPEDDHHPYRSGKRLQTTSSRRPDGSAAR
ncbi:hypothetical protein, partial [Mycobacterium avium]|uniref:hypothetical protein n=1 Tax=Mycobacterium avium TaxID=1764 RepID=UPI001F27DAC1